MRSRKWLMMAIVVAFLWADRACLGVGRPALRISELVNQSDAVVVADVSEIKPVGRTSVGFGGVALAAQLYRAEAVALYKLAGSCQHEFSVEFVLPDTSTGYRSVKTGIRMLFLKKSGTTYNPTSPYYPDFPAVRFERTEFQGLEGAELVYAELSAVVVSADASLDDKWEVLRQSFAIPDSNKLFVNDLLVGLQNTADLDLHRRIQAELIGRNDISELQDVCNVLLADTLSANQKEVLLFRIGRDLKNEKAVPGLKQLLQSADPQVRVASAQALWHIASAFSIGALTEALNDQNRDVRYYAIRGLADITGELQWGPSLGEYEEHEAKYRQHWLEWASQNSEPHTHN
jgi:hypothetical protein